MKRKFSGKSSVPTKPNRSSFWLRTLTWDSVWTTYKKNCYHCWMLLMRVLRIVEHVYRYNSKSADCYNLMHTSVTRILTAEGQRLVSEGPPVNIHHASASPYLCVCVVGGGGVRDGQLLMLSPNLLKSQIPYAPGEGGGGVFRGGQLSNFWCWVQIC